MHEEEVVIVFHFEDGEKVELPINRYITVKTAKKFLYFEELKNAKWRLTTSIFPDSRLHYVDVRRK